MPVPVIFAIISDPLIESNEVNLHLSLYVVYTTRLRFPFATFTRPAPTRRI